MLQHEFDAQVVNGQLIPAESLRAFEGKQVRVTVAEARDEVPPGAAADEYQGVEPPEDFDVEKDVYVRMPFPSQVVPNAVIVKGGGLKPCLILPEDLPHE